MTYRYTFVQFEPEIAEILNEFDARLEPHAPWGLMSVAMWLGLPLLFGLRARKARQLLEGDAV